MNQLLGFDEKYLRLSNHPLAYWKQFAAWESQEEAAVLFSSGNSDGMRIFTQYSDRETAGMG